VSLPWGFSFLGVFMKTRTPMKAMRAKCLDCSCQQPKEVRLCTVKKCPLWPYRMGRRPKTDELILIQQKGAKEHAAVSVG
jgi:hypothetical protein